MVLFYDKPDDRFEGERPGLRGVVEAAHTDPRKLIHDGLYL